MNRLRASTLGALLALAALAAGAGGARAAVAVSVGTGSGLAGQTVNIAINTASLTGLNVTSLQFTLNYNNTQVTPVGIVTTGGLVNATGWQSPQWSVLNSGSTGTLSLSDAGSLPLAGSGALLFVTFQINSALINGGGTSLTLTSFQYDEGSPAVTLTGGSITINPTPQIYLSPGSGQVIRGNTLQFSVSGSPTPPIAYATSNPSVATISATGLLTGVAPGTVTVTATDAASHGASAGPVVVYAMGVTAGTGSTVAGNPVTIPVTVTSLTGLGIRSGQMELAYNRSFLNLASITTPAGTLLNGWGSVTWSQKATGALLDFVGSTNLAGSGILFYLNFTTSASAPGSTYISFVTALFNETLNALPTTGSITVSALPTLSVSPPTQTLLAGQTQQYTVSGATLPVTWSVVNPAIASISATGLVTALTGGDTQVRVQDAVGAVGYSTLLSVYDLRVTLGSGTGPPGSTVKLPITADRLVGGLNIWSMQFVVDWTGTSLANGRSLPSGLWGAWGVKNSVSKFNYGLSNLVCAGAGGAVLGNGGTQLASISLDIGPGVAPGTNIPLTLTGLMFNEGLPRALITNGTLAVSTASGVPPGSDGDAFALGAVQPNPVRDDARLPFTLPSAAADGTRARLGLYDVTGRRVRLLLDEAVGAGPHEAAWDGRDESGRAVPAGLYFARLEWGGLVATRRLTRIE